MGASHRTRHKVCAILIRRGCVLNMLCSNAIGRCDCDAAVFPVQNQGRVGPERHAKGDGACHEFNVTRIKFVYTL